MVFMSRKAFDDAIIAERKKFEEDMWKREQEARIEKKIFELEDRISVLEMKIGIRAEDGCCESKQVIR